MVIDGLIVTVQSQFDTCKQKNRKLESENFVLKQHLLSRQDKIDALKNDQARLEMDLEWQSEKFVLSLSLSSLSFIALILTRCGIDGRFVSDHCLNPPRDS